MLSIANKINSLILLLGLLMLVANCQLVSPTNYIENLDPQVCDSIRTIVMNDYAKKELKYYVFGIAAPTEKTVRQLKDYCEVNAESAGCLMNKRLSYYNQVVDSIVYQNTGKNIHAFIAN